MTPEPKDPSNGRGDRFLSDRRAGRERRSGTERRSISRRVFDITVEREQRGQDRRDVRERRRKVERRRPSDAQFTWEETLRIQQVAVNPSLEASCPRCHGRLLMGPPERNERVVTREVHCTSCRHSVAIVEER
jgi:hypothetical protein